MKIIYIILYTSLTWVDYGGHSYLQPVTEQKIFYNQNDATNFRREAKAHNAFISEKCDTLKIIK